MHKAVRVLLFLLCACSVPKKPAKWICKGITPLDESVTRSLADSSIRHLDVLYLGTGSLLIRYKGSQLLTDPYYSHQPLHKVLLGNIRTDTASQQLALSYVKRAGFDLKQTDALLLNHAHYDHILDLPWLLEKDLLPANLTLLGSKSAKALLKNFLQGEKFEPVRDKPLQEWIPIGDKIRVFPVLTDHPWHFLRWHLMKGEVDAASFNSFTKSTQKLKAGSFKEGEIWAYIVDFMQAGKPGLRLFIRGPGCDLAKVSLPDSILNQRPVDLAIMHVAAHKNIGGCSYPGDFLRKIKPGRAIYVHWEDFFRDYTKAPKTVIATNFNSLFRKTLNARDTSWNFRELNERIVMPFPGTIIRYNP